MPSRNIEALAELVFSRRSGKASSVPDTKRDIAIKAALSPLPKGSVDSRYVLLKDIGIITVPDDYEHEICLESLRRQDEINDANRSLTDEHYPNPTRIIKAGETYHVRAFGQAVPNTTSKERMQFLKSLGAQYVGAQGIVLVYGNRQQLPSGYWYASFDEEERLWQNSDRRYGVPCLIKYADGGYGLDLGDFGKPWPTNVAFLCFNEIKEDRNFQEEIGKIGTDGVIEQIPRLERRLNRLRLFIKTLPLEKALKTNCLKNTDPVVIPFNKQCVVFKTNRGSKIGFVIHRKPFDGNYDSCIEFPFGTRYKLLSGYANRLSETEVNDLVGLCKTHGISTVITFGNIFYGTKNGVLNKISYERDIAIDEPFKMVLSN